jgi:hypothetical protein
MASSLSSFSSLNFVIIFYLSFDKILSDSSLIPALAWISNAGDSILISSMSELFFSTSLTGDL